MFFAVVSNDLNELQIDATSCCDVTRWCYKVMLQVMLQGADMKDL